MRSPPNSTTAETGLVSLAGRPAAVELPPPRLL
jgi:hypothetical protein